MLRLLTLVSMGLHVQHFSHEPDREGEKSRERDRVDRDRDRRPRDDRERDRDRGERDREAHRGHARGR